MTSKKLTSSAGLTIPKDLRLRLGWKAGMSVDIEPTSDGALLIRAHSPRCRFCGAYGNVHRYKDINICAECAQEMKEAI
ncbi:AbrB/MazE/SpoVT family DNA-binding domain-containing protein [Ruminococcus flavefaciens]|uniref:AbrB/MazE/SpoVT family DNA-binding domain-containing protein n=1 Tax=Ruminococcus flavefaciens TaxID=1265 RepID=UPI001566B433|nr:AbrB/MazE/SpoVT family DNA-binding domain-containing protein [Ruminococcus flavefaciens]